MEAKQGAPKKAGKKGAAKAAPAIESVFGSKAGSPQQPLYDNVTKQEEEQRLIAVLKSEGQQFDKDVACRRLAVIGTKAAVPALTALLSDQDLCDVARTPLETIPDPAADEALRAAMGQLKGRLLIGVINSIGVRKDSNAGADLIKRLSDADAGVAEAAAAALGKIGTPEAAKALEQALADGPAAIRPAVADACITVADNWLVAGKNAEAAALFDKVRGAKPSKPILVAATRGAILARQNQQGNGGAPLLIEQLKGEDWDLSDLALRLAREIKGADLTRALAAEVGNLPPPKRVLLLKALGDRRDPAALSAVLEATKSGEPKVRVAALQAVAQLGDSTAVPVLFAAALDPEAEVAAAAQASLAGIPNTNTQVNDAIAARLADKDSKVRRVAIEAVGKRLIGPTVPQLIKAADDSDAQIRVAVLNALTALALARRGEPAAKDEAKKAALALCDKLAQSNPAEASEAKRKLTETSVTTSPAPMKSPGL